MDAQLAALGERVKASGEILDAVPPLANQDLQVVVRMPFRPYRFPA